MAKEKIDLKKQLQLYRFEFDILQDIPCSKQENKQYKKLIEDVGVLPDGVYAYVYDGVTSTTEFYTVYGADLTESEKKNI